MASQDDTQNVEAELMVAVDSYATARTELSRAVFTRRHDVAAVQADADRADRARETVLQTFREIMTKVCAALYTAGMQAGQEQERRERQDADILGDDR